MYIAGIMDHFSSAPKMELIVWGLTVGKFVFSSSSLRDQLRSAKSRAGDIKPGSTGPRIWTDLALFGQFCGFLLPQFVCWTTIACNRFHQPKWMVEHALPSPPDVFGVDGVVIGRAIGLLSLSVWGAFTATALRTLGDQYYPIGVREKPRLVDDGLFAYVRHPIYTGSLMVEASYALAFWSYIPLYAALFAISGCILKVPIEERTMVEDPVLGEHYKRYKIKVPYRIIPYIW